MLNEKVKKLLENLALALQFHDPVVTVVQFSMNSTVRRDMLYSVPALIGCRA